MKTLIAGVDEVGRGAWAGPVVAAAVIVPEGWSHALLVSRRTPFRDSKQLTAKQRDLVCMAIYNECHVGTGTVSEQEIDQLGLEAATLKAMEAAVRALPTQPYLVKVDGVHRIPSLGISQQPAAKGDTRFVQVAAASVVAKVTRDTLMAALADVYPNFNWVAHKGYGTTQHASELRTHGPCAAHRQSFKPVKAAMEAIYAIQ